MSAKWIIKDWAGNLKFNGKSFESFEDGEDFLCQFLGDNYDTDRQEFFVIEVQS